MIIRAENRLIGGVVALLLILWALTVLTATPAKTADPISYPLCDIRVLYLFDEPGSIDWPTVYHLNDRHACRVDLVTFRPGGEFRTATREVPNSEIFVHRVYDRERDEDLIDSALATLFGRRRPDIVIIGDASGNGLGNTLVSHFSALQTDTTALFNVSKLYVRSDHGESDAAGSEVLINSQELLERYRNRMKLEIADLVPSFSVDAYRPPRLTRYRLLRSASDDIPAGPEIVSGLRPIRLTSLIDSLLTEGPVARTLVNRAKNYVSFFTMAKNSNGRQRIDNLVAGQKEIVTLGHQIQSDRTLSANQEFVHYLQYLTEMAQSALLREINMDWQGKIFWRDSPHGPKLKFRASLAVNGPEQVELSYVHFHPYWDSAVVVLDDESRKVLPHQMFVREYMVEIDRQYLDSSLPDSLTFSAEIVFGQIPLPLISSIPVRDRPSLNITFEPDFHFVPPVARINVDQVVSSMNWKAIIHKPIDYAGEVTIDLEAPRGLFAGAYRQHWNLEKGRTAETVRIPFSVSNLFEQGIHRQTISLYSGGKELAADTGRIRIASCEIDDKVKVGFLPDSTGLLEDILRMTNATFQPLTDRALVTADIDAYNVMVIGSGAYNEYPALLNARDRIEDYLRNGGSLVIMGQPSDWPEGILPVSFLPGPEPVKKDQITIRIPHARILSQPYAIKQDDLLSFFGHAREVSAAVVAPSERVFSTPTGATLLSVSRIGDGQIIYCGLPLTEMIAELNLEAIHLLGNILNY